MTFKKSLAGLVLSTCTLAVTAAPQSLWGPNDEAGASNHITPTKVLSAMSLIQTGQIYELGRIYEQAMPLFGTRVFRLTIPGSPTGGPLGANNLIYHDEMLSSEIGQVGTQFDGLGHIGRLQGNNSDNKNQMLYYNGFTEGELMPPALASAEGLSKLGIEKIKPIITRGILIDIEAVRGEMNAGDEITMGDVNNALAAQGLSANAIEPGDAVLFRTNWGRHWITNNEAFNSGAPGIGLNVADWLVSKDVALVGSDTWPVEVVPNPDATLAFPVHQKLLTDNGIFLHENLDLEALASDRVYQFAYIFVRLPLKGATGSPGSPIAVR